MIENDYRMLGLLAITILFVGLVFIALRWPKDRHATFSQHIASRKLSVIYYIALFSVVLPLLLLFFFRWFISEFGLSIWFGALIALSSATQYLCTLIPEIGGWRTNAHRFLAGISAMVLVPALTLLFTSDQISALDAVISAVGLTVMLSIIAIVVTKKGEPRNFLILQSVYFMAFFVPILVVSYL